MPFLFFNKLWAFRARSQTPPQPAAPRLISASLTENLAYLRGAFAETSDLVVRRIVIGGRDCAQLKPKYFSRETKCLKTVRMACDVLERQMAAARGQNA